MLYTINLSIELCFVTLIKPLTPDDTALTVCIKLAIPIELSSVEFIYIFVDVNKEF